MIMNEPVQLMMDWSETDEWNKYAPWILTNKGDQSVRKLMDRHYSRQTIGDVRFTRPGMNLVLRTAEADACFIAWRSHFKRKDVYDAWEITAFRNESDHLASELILSGILALLDEWGEPPKDGIITYVHPRKVKNKRHQGYCFRAAGFNEIGASSKGLLLFQLIVNEVYLKEQERIQIGCIESVTDQIEVGLACGEFFDVYDFHKQALIHEQQVKRIQRILKLKRVETQNYTPVMTQQELQNLISPYEWFEDDSIDDFIDDMGVLGGKVQRKHEPVIYFSVGE